MLSERTSPLGSTPPPLLSVTIKFSFFVFFQSPPSTHSFNNAYCIPLRFSIFIGSGTFWNFRQELADCSQMFTRIIHSKLMFPHPTSLFFLVMSSSCVFYHFRRRQAQLSLFGVINRLERESTREGRLLYWLTSKFMSRMMPVSVPRRVPDCVYHVCSLGW